MEGSGFHNQLLSVMDVLAKAAVAEIHRRVDDSCAVLRVEVSQSRRDIDLLRRKCEGMEAELRRTRIRARRKVFPPPAAHRLSPLVRVVVNTETQTTDWDGQTEFAVLEPTDNAEEALVKMECSEEEMWKNHSEDKIKSDEEQPSCLQVFHPTQTVGFVEPHSSAENQADLGSLESPTGSYNNPQDQSEAELLVKHEREEELHENTADLDSVGHFETDEGNGHLWTSGQWIEDADPCSSYAGQQFSSVLPSQSGLHLDEVPQTQTVEKSQSNASAANMKKCIRTFGSERQDEGNSLTQFDSMDSSVIPRHPCRDKAPHTGHQNMTVIPLIQESTSSHGYSGINSVLARRIRTPWRSAMKEKKFSCSFCSRTFYKRCQLKEHLRSHTGERPFSCKLCGRSFAKQCNLIRHAVVHSGERPHKCLLCGKCFTQRSSLKSHQKTAH